jgi:two-component system, LytTR family, response regulator
MIKAIHIEDEERNVLLLDTLIKKHCSKTISLEGSASNITDALLLIEKVNPQLVFLDIEIEGGNSFQLLDKIGAFNFQVIFITAFNEYAIKAFKYNAIDYLLKPIDTIELQKAVEKVDKRLTESSGNSNLVELLNFMKGNDKPQKIGISVHDGVLFVNTEDIITAEARGSYCILHLVDNKTITTIQSLGLIENLLPQKTFIRVHNSWVINTNYLKKYYRGKNGYMEMEDGSTVQVSLRKKGGFLDFLNNQV